MTLYLGTLACLLTVVSNGALVITVVVHEYLPHLPVVEVVQVSDGVLGASDQVQEHVGRLHTGNKLMLEKSLGIKY